MTSKKYKRKKTKMSSFTNMGENEQIFDKRMGRGTASFPLQWRHSHRTTSAENQCRKFNFFLSANYWYRLLSGFHMTPKAKVSM